MSFRYSKKQGVLFEHYAAAVSAATRRASSANYFLEYRKLMYDQYTTHQC